MPSATFPPSTNDACEMPMVCTPSVPPFQLDLHWHFIMGSSLGSMSLPVFNTILLGGSPYHPCFLDEQTGTEWVFVQGNIVGSWDSNPSWTFCLGFRPQFCHRVDPVLSHMEVHCTPDIDTTVKRVYVTMALLLRDRFGPIKRVFLVFFWLLCVHCNLSKICRDSGTPPWTRKTGLRVVGSAHQFHCCEFGVQRSLAQATVGLCSKLFGCVFL